MDINLQHVIDNCEDFERPIAEVMVSTLKYEADTDLVAAKLADDIKFICQAEHNKVKSRTGDSTEGNEAVLLNIWMLVIDIAHCIPTSHPMQDRLVQALENIRLIDGIVPGYNKAEWSELPELDMYLLDTWNISQDSSRVDEIDAKEAQEWMNYNSFVARLMTPSFSPYMNFPIWQLREALEEPPIDGVEEPARIWIACEWILRCDEIIFDFIRPEKQPAEKSLSTGSLCGEEISQWGVGRWDFWRKRLSELSDDAEKLELEEDLVERMEEAVARMDTISQRDSGGFLRRQLGRLSAVF